VLCQRTFSSVFREVFFFTRLNCTVYLRVYGALHNYICTTLYKISNGIAKLGRRKGIYIGGELKELTQLFSSVTRELYLHFFCKDNLLKVRNLLFCDVPFANIFLFKKVVPHITALYIKPLPSRRKLWT